MKLTSSNNSQSPKRTRSGDGSESKNTDRPRFLVTLSGLLYAAGGATLAICATISLQRIDFNPDTISTGYLAANLLLMAAFVLDRRQGAISFITQFFLLFFIALPAYVQIDRRIYPFGGMYSHDQLAATFEVLSIFQLVFLMALVIPRNYSKSSRFEFHGFERTGGVPGTWIILLFLAFACVLAGPSALFSARFSETMGVGETTGLTDQVLMVARSASLFLLVLLIWRRRGTNAPGAITRPERLQLWLTLPLFSALNFPPALPRFQLLGTAIAIFLLFVNAFRPTTKLALSVGGAAFLFLGFAQLKSLGSGVGQNRAANLSPTDYLLRVDFDAFKQIMDTTIYLELGGAARWLDSIVGVVLFWVPRSVWPAKPVSAGSQVSQFLGYSYTNVSSPLPAEALLAFGILGVIVLGVFCGLGVAHVENRIRTTGGATSTFVLYVLIAGFATIILRGALNAVAPMFLAGIALYTAYWVAGRIGFALSARNRRQNAHTSMRARSIHASIV